MTASNRVVCEVCAWMGTTADVLKAPDPFEPDDECWGCPNCKSIDRLRRACDEPGCWREPTCGTPTTDGYRHTCGEHRPKTKGGA